MVVGAAGETVSPRMTAASNGSTVSGPVRTGPATPLSLDARGAVSSRTGRTSEASIMAACPGGESTLLAVDVGGTVEEGAVDEVGAAVEDDDGAVAVATVVGGGGTAPSTLAVSSSINPSAGGLATSLPLRTSRPPSGSIPSAKGARSEALCSLLQAATTSAAPAASNAVRRSVLFSASISSESSLATSCV